MQVSFNCRPKMRICRGATYKFPTVIKINNKEVTANDIEKIEFAFSGDLIKIYPGDIEKPTDDKTFIVELSAEETMSLNCEEDKIYQARITFNDGSVKFTKPIHFIVVKTLFSEVMSDE